MILRKIRLYQSALHQSAANQEEDAIKQDKPSEENTVKVKVVVIVVKIK